MVIKVSKNSQGNIIVDIHGQEVSAEAFMATDFEEFGISQQEAFAIEDKIENLQD